MEKVNLKTQNLKKKLIEIFKKHGLSNDHATISANAIINAELVGAPTHGLSRLKMYCDRINKKVINPQPKLKIKKISQSISQIDADNSIGFVAADIGIKQAIKNAKKTGIGFVENVAKKYFQYEVIWITIFIMGMLGLLFDITLRKLIDKYIPWRGKG